MNRCLTFLGLVLLAPGASAQVPPPDRVVGGNAMYEASIRSPDHPYYGMEMAGAFALYTGPGHPLIGAGGRRAQLTAYVPAFDDVAGVSSSSFVSVRSYDSATDYLLGINPGFALDPTPGYTCVLANERSLPTLSTIDEGGVPVGARATWTLREGGDDLLVELIARAHGEDFMSSSMELSVRVVNLGAAEAHVGVHVAAHALISGLTSVNSHTYRFVALRPPDPPVATVLTDESEFVNPTFRMWQVMRRLLTNPATDHPPYAIAGAVTGPATLDPPPTPPDVLRFTYDNFALTPPYLGIGEWTYCFDGGLASPPRDLDFSTHKLVVAVWGPDEPRAVIVPAGDEVTFTQHFVAFRRYPLAADAGTDVEVGCDGAETTVALTGTPILEQPTAARVHHHWTCDDPRVRFTLPDDPTTDAIIAGVGTFTARYTTWVGAYEASDDVEIRVVDVEPPRVDVAVASPTSLWPPNHRLVDVDIVLSVVDACDPAPTVRLIEARSNEGLSPLQRGAGHADPDIEGFDVGSDDRHGQLRGERSGMGMGREYTLVYAVTDASGNVTRAEVVVGVAHDQGKRWTAGSARGGNPRR